MDIQNINKNIIKDYIKNCNANDIELKIFLGLYSNYYSVQQTLPINSKDNKLTSYEEEIYTIGNEIISDINRICIEIDKIQVNIPKEKNQKIVRYIITQINNINELLQKNPDSVIELIDYIKKQIVRIQILLGMDITFYNAAYELFINEYTKISEESNMKRMVK